MNIIAKVFENEKLINEFTVIENGSRKNFDELKKYCCNNHQYEDCKYSIDLLKDYGFNYCKDGISTEGLEIFRSYEFADLKYTIKFEEMGD